MAKLFLRSSPQSRVLAACISTNMANQHVEHAAHFLETKLHKLFWFHIVQTAWIVGAQLYLCWQRPWHYHRDFRLAVEELRDGLNFTCFLS